MNGKVVLLVEDNEHVMKLNRMVLSREGYSVVAASCISDARRKIQGNPVIDMVVLDVGLPDGNGIDFIPELKRTIHAPILLLSGKRNYEDMVRGLTGGADDYMTKPYRVEELLARLAALLYKREEAHQPFNLSRGPLTLDTVAQKGFIYGRDILLQPREYAVLFYMMHNEGEIITTECLYEKVWRLPVNGNMGAVIATVSRLRKKLRGSGYTITSGRSGGYCFMKGDDYDL